MASLQEQLLKAGLADEKKSKKALKQKRQQQKVARKSKQTVVDETKIAAEKALAEKAERDRALNQQREAKALEKAIGAQIKQLIEMNKISDTKGDIGYNFTDGTIKKLYVTKPVQDQLSNGRLAIVKWLDSQKAHYEIVPAIVADKIAQRDASFVVLLNDKSQEVIDEDDPYADFPIPDDLMW